MSKSILVLIVLGLVSVSNSAKANMPDQRHFCSLGNINLMSELWCTLTPQGAQILNNHYNTTTFHVGSMQSGGRSYDSTDDCTAAERAVCLPPQS